MLPLPPDPVYIWSLVGFFKPTTLTALLQKVLTHSAKGLLDETNAALLTQKFWIHFLRLLLPWNGPK